MLLFDVAKNQFRRLFPSNQAKIFGRWKKDGAEKLRYEYNLDENSMVFDVGGYEGEWAEKISRTYNPTIHIFEPVKEYAEALKRKFAGNAKIIVHECGLSDKNMTTEIMLDDNKSSLYIKGAKREKINLIHAADFIRQNKIEKIDVMKINIEGGEYTLLEQLIKTGLIEKIKNIQVQFYNFVPNAETRMKKIQEALSRTHHLTYQYKFVWENWQRNTV